MTTVTSWIGAHPPPSATPPDPPPPPVTWAAWAACRGRTELFFAPHAERADARQRREAQARALCEGCPVAAMCRAWARRRREYGFWGGESEEERAAAGYPVALPVGRVARLMRNTRFSSERGVLGRQRDRRPGSAPELSASLPGPRPAKGATCTT